jgi:dolichol-phosphate mannosyltransferase
LSEPADLSVIIPTYNEYENILHLIEIIKDKLPDFLFTEIVIVDDNSPDGTASLIENYIKNQFTATYPRVIELDHQACRDFTTNSKKSVVKLIRRQNKTGLISAVMEGIKSSTGRFILVMDADFSHPPEAVPRLIDELLHEPNCVVIASRYITGGSIIGWTYKRLVVSRIAAKIARHGLRLWYIKDPISGFFAFPRQIIENIPIDSSGFKLLLEILVKAREVRVKEVPYTFSDRKRGESKLDAQVVWDYVQAVWYLYRYGRKSKNVPRDKGERRVSVLFFSKAARFYTVGATGLLLNYIVSVMLSKVFISNFWYIQASTIGIFLSITSNFFLNKIWTFEDANFSARKTAKQYGLFVGLSSIGAVVQLMLLYLFVESGFQYTVALLFAVAAASIGNFVLNKKWTFHEKIWG